MMQMTQIPQQDRPREKMLARDAGSLSDLELLAVILGRGTSKMPVMEMARHILQLYDRKVQVEIKDLLGIEGVGPAKATLLLAAMEFVRRKVRPAGFKIREALDLVPLIRHYADRKQEYFICASLNGANELIATRVVSIGAVNMAAAQPREVFADPIADRAASVVLAHNHPSGNVRPSNSDFALTRRLSKAGDLLGIPVMDHLVFTHYEHRSIMNSERYQAEIARLSFHRTLLPAS